MHKVGNRLDDDPPVESNTEHETINSLVEALSSVSDSLQSSIHSSLSSNSSAASLSLNFTAPVPEPQLGYPAPNQETPACRIPSAAATSRIPRPVQPLRPYPEATEAASRKEVVRPPVKRVGICSEQDATAPVSRSRNAAPSRGRILPYATLQRHTAQTNSQVWRVATGQPRYPSSRLMHAHVMHHQSSRAVPPARLSARTSASQPLPQWRSLRLPLHAAGLGHAGGMPAPLQPLMHARPAWAPQQPAHRARPLAAIRTTDSQTSGLSMTQLNELGEIMDEIIKRMSASMQGGATDLSIGGRSTPLPLAGPSHGETQELTNLLQEAEQVMLALRQAPTIGGSHSAALAGPPMRSMLQKVQSWVEYSQLSSVDSCSTSQPPYSPLSRASLTASAGHTLGNSDSDMMDFIPALALPMQIDTARYVSHGTEAVLLSGQMQPATAVALPVVATIEPPVPATLLPLSSHRSAVEMPVAAPAGRPGNAAKPGSSTDTLPGPPATPFSAASDSDAVGPSTPSNSFAQGSASGRPASLPVTQSRTIMPVEEGAASEVPNSTTLDAHDALAAGTTAWTELPKAELLKDSPAKVAVEGWRSTGGAQTIPRRWRALFHACFGGGDGLEPSLQRDGGGTPRKVSRKITDAKKNKEQRTRIGCSCL